MKSKISSAAWFLMLIGALSIVLNFLGRVPKLLVWIDQWGEGPGWAIRIGITVLGAVLIVVSKKMKD